MKKALIMLIALLLVVGYADYEKPQGRITVK